ncbi:inositol 2-dehydrogenase [Microbacterium allomyrinae]|uniref:Inositol 2-dehydrogenase n=1 Tax=Microbacterium allomyrinae TaxID=2830666 RepID=A0A9X1LTM8_9MICO|nr:inositol 2-dehydrogenase [Microbacterium allomyrinae]MCC2031548.1 inositol 2-dehydrogenase [Microbacterium allomyrinae]
MTSPAKIGLIGTGRIGKVHAASIAALPETTLQWVCDPFIEGAEATAQLFGGVHVTADPRDVISSGDVDAVVIAAPTPTHVDLIDLAIDAGVPVLCEKPIDLDILRVDALREKARAASTLISLGFNRRFDPHFAELHRRVSAGEIGALEQLIITSRDPEPPPAAYVAVSGGIFRDMTIHDFDMARFFVPNIVEVTAHGGNQFSGMIADADDYDSAVVVLRGADGEFVTITNSRHSVYGYDQRLEAFGDEGLLQVGNIGPSNVRSSTSAGIDTGSEIYGNIVRYTDAYRLELAAFVEALRGGEDRTPGFEDGRAALILADAALLSAKENITVAVDLSA